ncbi:MAG: peptide deformylase [Candidatus Omnitrophota bacterium]
MLKICINNIPVLRKKSLFVENITAQEKTILEQMLKIMYKSQGVGLAAPQVGILKQLIVVDVGDGPLKLINPKIIRKTGKKITALEGCLSLPEITVKVMRSKNITVKAQDINGDLVKIEATDLFSRALQHEIDHLQGKLIIDYLPWLKRIGLKQKIKKSCHVF